MKLSDFRVGLEFWCSDRRWRCTDVGSRVVVAIRVDEATIVRMNNVTKEQSTRTLSGEDAERDGWFAGPPYAVAEVVFDEYDLEGCELEPETKTPAAEATGAGR